MIFTQLFLEGAYLVEPSVYQDDRGLFYRFYCTGEFDKIGHHKPWAQINLSFTKTKNTIRGMHFQHPPNAEIKLVKCTAGRILDVIIDLRKGSKTYLKWLGIEISAENRHMIYVPEGFAHGFQTLSDDCELIYHHSAPYVPESEDGIRWNDPLIGIEWPMPPVHISLRDQQHPLLTPQFSGINFNK